MVVGAPDVDDALEAALVLVQVVGDVRGEVGVEAVVTLYDAVLLVAERRRLEPLGAVLFVQVAGLFQLVDAARHQPGVEQRLLREPDLEMHAEVLEVAAAVLELFGQHVVVHIVPFLAEQCFRARDHRIAIQ